MAAAHIMAECLASAATAAWSAVTDLSARRANAARIPTTKRIKANAQISAFLPPGRAPVPCSGPGRRQHDQR